MNTTTLARYATLACLFAAVTATADPQSVIIIPDTQKYAEGTPTDVLITPPFDSLPDGIASIFNAQTQWIADNAVSNNIKFVTHVGDIVENGVGDNAPNGIGDVYGDAIADVEWARANTAMSTLDLANIPYLAALGNHDNLDAGQWHEDPDNPGEYVGWDPAATNYLKHFGPTRYNGKPWYSGHSPTGRSHVATIDMEGREVMFLHLSLDTPQVELDWAQGVLDANRDKLVVVTTHRYLYDFRLLAGRYGDNPLVGQFDSVAPTGLADELYDPDGMSSEDFFQDFVAKNRNIFAVIAGHNYAQYHQISTNDFGLPVYEILLDFQSGANGGNGFMGEMIFDFMTGEFSLQSFSPLLGRDRNIGDAFLEVLFGVITFSDVLAPVIFAETGLTVEEFIVLLKGDSLDPNFSIPPEEQAIMLAALELVDGDARALLESAGLYDLDASWEELYRQIFGDGSRDDSFHYTGINFDAYIPEPAAAPALFGLVGLLLARRRK